MSNEIRLLATLSNAFGPSGYEEDIRDILRKELEKYADETKIDKLGNIFFYHHGKDNYPKIMLSAHMDEVGFIVTYIENEGFLRFDTLGGIAANILPWTKNHSSRRKRIHQGNNRNQTASHNDS